MRYTLKINKPQPWSWLETKNQQSFFHSTLLIKCLNCQHYKRPSVMKHFNWFFLSTTMITSLCTHSAPISDGHCLFWQLVSHASFSVRVKNRVVKSSTRNACLFEFLPFFERLFKRQWMEMSEQIDSNFF